MDEDEIKFERIHLKNIASSMSKVEQEYDQTIQGIAREVSKYDIRNPESFDWSKYRKLKNRLSNIIGTLTENLNSIILNSMVQAWNLANQKNDLLTNQYLRNIDITQGTAKQYLNQNVQALNEFINRTEGGMNLSSNIWNTSNGMMDELKTYLGNGIATGKPAAAISRDIRNVLKDPDMLFRRVNKDGKLVLSKPAQAYHPGAGKYRSSYKNALRLTATETNMAYRMSDSVRRQQLDFVVGIEVHLSDSHPKEDICDFMQGIYPKDFVYRGWHPWCLCYTTSILMSGSEFNRIQDGKLKESKKTIHDIPASADEYIQQNADKIVQMENKPYWINDNFKIDKGGINYVKT